MARSELHDLAYPMLALAGLTTVAAVPFGLLSDVDPAPLAERTGTTPYVLDGSLALLASVLLAFGVAGLAAQQGSHGRRIGTIPLLLALLAAICGVYLQVIHTFILPSFAGPAPDLVNNPPAGPAAIAVAGGLVLMVVGLVALAVSAFRSRVFPRPAAVLIAIGQLGFLAGSVSGLVLGAGLLWAGLAGLRTESAIQPLGV